MKTILIFGTGSIALQHVDILKKVYNKPKIFFFSHRKSNKYLNKQNSIKGLKPDLIIVASKTSDHQSHLDLIEKFYKDTLVLVEKPLFNKVFEKKYTKNKILINYNLRFHEMIKKLKKIINLRNVFSVYISCMSFLPEWRKNIDYKSSYSSSKKKGGGVALDLSHEIDYAQFLFGKISRINNSYSGKISNLSIDSDDILFFSCFQKSIKSIFYLDYFTKINKREIIVNEKNRTIVCDLINSRIEIRNILTNQYKIFKFKLKKNHSLLNVHNNIKKENFLNFCTFREGLQIVKLIKTLKKKNI